MQQVFTLSLVLITWGWTATKFHNRGVDELTLLLLHHLNAQQLELHVRSPWKVRPHSLTRHPSLLHYKEGEKLRKHAWVSHGERGEKITLNTAAVVAESQPGNLCIVWDKLIRNFSPEGVAGSPGWWKHLGCALSNTSKGVFCSLLALHQCLGQN